MSLNKKLEELDSVIQSYNSLQYQKLQDPLNENDIEQYLNEVNISDKNVKALYQWKNGAKVNSQCEIIKYGVFCSLELLVEGYKNNLDNTYDRSFITIVDDSDVRLLFNNKQGSSHYGKIYLYSIPSLYIDYPISYFDSVESMIETSVQAYKEGVCFYDQKKNTLRFDESIFFILAKSINKGSAYWTDHDPLHDEDWYEI